MPAPTEEALRSALFYRALHRPMQLMGAERNPMLFLTIVCGALPLTAISLDSAVLSMVVWFSGTWILRKMAKADPLMSEVYSRHTRHPAYYPAFSRPWRKSSTARLY